MGTRAGAIPTRRIAAQEKAAPLRPRAYAQEGKALSRAAGPSIFVNETPGIMRPPARPRFYPAISRSIISAGSAPVYSALPAPIRYFRSSAFLRAR